MVAGLPSFHSGVLEESVTNELEEKNTTLVILLPGLVCEQVSKMLSASIHKRAKNRKNNAFTFPGVYLTLLLRRSLAIGIYIVWLTVRRG